MFIHDNPDCLEAPSISEVSFTPNGTAKKIKWLDNAQIPGKSFELETRELFLKFKPEYINTNSLWLDLSETNSAQKKYDVDCFALINKRNLANNKKGFLLICECKTTQAKQRMKAINHGFFNKIKANKTYITQRLRKLFKGYIPIYILATDGYNIQPDIKKKYLDEGIVVMTEIEIKYLNDCYGVSKSQNFTFNQFLTFFRTRTRFYDDLVIGAFETFTDFSRKKNKVAYTFSAPARQMLQLSGVAHRVAKDLVSDSEGRLLNTDHYQRILSKNRLTSLGNYLDRNKKPYTNNILLSYRGTKKDFNFRYLDSIGQGRTGELKIPGKPGTFHVIDGQHRLFGYLATSDDRVLDHTLICTVFTNLTQAEEAQIFIDVNANQKKVDIGLRREVQLLLGDAQEGPEQVENLATLIVISLREDKKSPFNKKPLAIPEPESGGILPVEQLRKALLNGSLLARSKDFKKGRFNVDDDFQKTEAFASHLIIEYFIRIRAAVEKQNTKKDQFWIAPSRNNKFTALRTNFICGCILLLERFIEEASKGKDIPYNKIETSIEKYVLELINSIENMTQNQRTLLFAWNKNGVDMEEGSGKFPSARAHLIDELLPSSPELLYGDERKDYIDIPIETQGLNEVQLIIAQFDENNLGKKALALEPLFHRRFHKYLACLFGEDYWTEIIEIHFSEQVAKKVMTKKSQFITSPWVKLQPDIKDVSYKNNIDWCEWTQVRELFEGFAKDSHGVFQQALVCKQNIDIRILIEENHYLTTELNVKPQGVKNGLKWMELIPTLRNRPSHPRDGQKYTQAEHEAFSILQPLVFDMFRHMDEFIAEEEEL
ncbi:DGQHR domain-containing protein [Gammaproteobacteria bacterium]|nr:DGQHR domain-containing protein [Gammaproteobacteria bacterium]